jgi:hypothetical protein
MAYPVSENARHAVNHIFTRAASANLVMSPADSIEIQQLPGNGLIETPEENIFVLTISSYRFRLLTVFHLEPAGRNASYFCRDDSAQGFLEAFSEIGNLCCGAMNRELGKHFLHTGMSTPNILQRGCLTYLDELKPSYVTQFGIRINDSVGMHATLCLCAYAPIDFRVDPQAAAEETGALEFF